MSAAAQAQSADLVVNHSDSPDPGPAGGLFTYMVRVDNNGPATATAVQLADTLPAGSEFISVSSSAGSCSHAAGTITCALGDIAFTDFVSVAIQVRLPSAGVWTNTATATSPTSDPNPGNNVDDQQSTTAVAAANLRLQATSSLADVVAGQPFTTTLAVDNLGPDEVPADGDLSLQFAVPSGASITALPSGSGWSCTPASGYPRTSGTIECRRDGPLAAGAAAGALTVPMVANQSGSITGAFSVLATKGDGTGMPDGDMANNTATMSVNGSAGSDVSIGITSSATMVASNGSVDLTLRPRMNGGQPPGAGGGPITVDLTLPVGATLNTIASTDGSGWVCVVLTATTGRCTMTGPWTGGNFTDMPAINANVTLGPAGVYAAQASITIPENDPVPANNGDEVSITSTVDADLRMVKSASLTPVVPGQGFNYTLNVSNLGPLPVPAGQLLTVTDAIPAGVTVTSAPTGSGWTCSNGGLPYPAAGPFTLSCTRSAALAVSGSTAITIPALISAAGSISNSACVAMSGQPVPVDPNDANDCSSTSGAATSLQADLQVVSKTASPDPVLAGQDLSYQIAVRNNGPDASTGVVVSDTLGSLIAGGGFRSATATQGSCSPSGVANGPTVNLSCELGALAAGAEATITIVVRPNRATSGPRSNTATIHSRDVGDPDRSNNSGSVTSQVTAVADVQVTKAASPSPVRAGAPLTYVATVRNNGPSTAAAVQLVDTLPANAAFVSLGTVTGGGSCSSAPGAGVVGGQLVCDWASIPSGTQYTVTYRVRPLVSAVGAEVANAAAVTTATLELVTSNNQAATSTPVIDPQLDVLINKVDSVDPVVLGGTTVYTVTLTNSGPSYATNVVMTDVFPDPAATRTAVFSYQGGLTVDSGGNCVEPPVDATSGTLTCTFPGLDSGGTATVTYAMRAESITQAGALTGTTFNAAGVVVDETETTLANNQTTHATTARRDPVNADLGLTKSGPASALPGQQLAYTITVLNSGPAVSEGAQVVDTLPAGLSFVSAPGCVAVDGVVSCPVGTLAVGASVQFTVTVAVAQPYAGANPLTNTAAVDAPGDPNPADNSASATTRVVLEPAAIPTLGALGLALLSASIAAGAFALRRRRMRA